MAHGPATANGGDLANGNAAKLSYYTPRYEGLQLGVSYTPATDNRGQVTNRIDNAVTAGAPATTLGYENVIDVSATYEREVSGLNLNLGATYESGDSELAAIEDLRAWEVGAVLGWDALQFAASYGDWSDSGQAVNSNNDQDFYTLGVAYTTGAWGLSATYLNSTVEQGVNDNEFDNISLGVDYQLAPGLTPYIDATFFDADIGGSTANDNQGSVVMLGTMLTF